MEENKTRLEEIFFKATGTYDERLFIDYAAQESADARPDYIPEDVIDLDKNAESLDANKDTTEEA